jgi:multiple sugar transport system permease protein
LTTRPEQQAADRVAVGVPPREARVDTPRLRPLLTVGLVFLGPAFALFSLFVVFPLIDNIWVSFHDWDGVGPRHWVGLSNYAALLSDQVFYTALRNNLFWIIAYLIVPPFLGLGLALFLNQSVSGIRIVRSLFFAPFVISQVVVGLVFAWFFNTQFGLLNQLLAGLGFEPVALLDGEGTATLAVIFAGLWPQTAYCTILYLAGLTAVRPDMIDAARLDGASGFALLWHVVLPQLLPVSLVVEMVCVVSALRSFDLVAIMTGGGPYNSSTVLAYYMYEQTFVASRYGYAAAIATILGLVMLSGVGFFLWQMLRRERAG